MSRDGRRARLFDQVLAELGEALWRLTAGYAFDEATRQDLHQDILVALWNALGSFREESSLRTFAYRVAHNRGLSFRAYSARRRHQPLTDVVVTDPRPGPHELAEASRRRDVLRAAVRTLPPSLRMPLMLHLDGVNNGEIAEIVGITEGNVAVRLSRARQAVTAAVRRTEAP